jgi:Outer membrane receptor for ferrienterochelin and colicins
MVQDGSGAPIPGAHVTAVRVHSGTVRAADTGDTGAFRFAGLAIGDYSLRIQKDGFTPVEIKLLPLSIGQILTQRIDLRPAEVIEKLEVREQADALDPTATTSSSALGGERIEESPAQNRSFLNFVLVAPGVASSAGSNSQRSGAGARSAQADSGFSFAGMRSRNNSLLIDGVDNRDETTGGNRVAIGLEMVQEFRVSGTSMSAESGGAAGGSVNMVTRSGTNLWHGDFTYFTQNELFNARNPEALSPQRPTYRRYQPGSSLGGPIRKDRTFFFGGFEQEWESGDEWSDSPRSQIDRINTALASPAFGRAAVHSIHRGLYPAKAAQSESSIKLNHQMGTANTYAVRYAFSRGTDHRDVQDTENFTDDPCAEPVSRGISRWWGVGSLCFPPAW